MKKLLFIPFAILALAGISQTTPKQKKQVKEVTDTVVSSNKYKDNIDDRMKGPNGEKVYIGTNGGRYYMKGNNKVYIQSKTKKKPA